MARAKAASRPKKPGKPRVLEPAIVIGATGLRAPASVIALAISPDGSRIATGDWDGNVHVFERTGACIFHARWIASDHRGRHGIQRLAFTRDGSVITGVTGIIGRGNLCAGHIASRTTWFETPDRYQSWDFSRDGREIVAVDAPRLVIINARDGTTTTQIALPSHVYPDQVVWSPDGAWIATTFYHRTTENKTSLLVLDGESYEVRGEYDLGVDHTGSKLAFIDGRIVMLGDLYNDKPPQVLWLDPATGRCEVKPIEGTTGRHELVVARAEATLCDKDDQRRVIDLRTGRIVRPLPADTAHVAASTDAIVTSHGVALRLWDRAWNEVAGAPGLSTAVTAIGFSRDRVITGDRTGIRQWGLDGSFVAEIDGAVVDLTHDGSAAVVIRDGRTIVVDVPDGRVREGGIDQELGSGAVSPDGKLLATRNYQTAKGHVLVWSFATGEVVAKLGIDATASTYGIAFSPDGKYLAGGGWAGTFKVYDVESRAKVAAVYQRNSWGEGAFSFSHDGTLLANGNHYRALRLWKLPSGTLAHDLKGHRRKVIQTSVFSPDDSLLASCDEADIRVWNTKTGELVAVARKGAFCLAFSPDGRWLAAGASGEAYLFAL